MSTYSPSAAVMTIAKREFTHALTSKGMILTSITKIFFVQKKYFFVWDDEGAKNNSECNTSKCDHVGLNW